MLTCGLSYNAGKSAPPFHQGHGASNASTGGEGTIPVT